jgi:PhzF family phenazine biosynthesis protein
MKLSFTTLDVFTSTSYAGNPVAIIKVPASESASLTQKQKQSVASEFNLSEIVFLHLPTEGTTTSKERKIDILPPLLRFPSPATPPLARLTTSSTPLVKT